MLNSILLLAIAILSSRGVLRYPQPSLIQPISLEAQREMLTSCAVTLNVDET